jgi:molybdopterin-guanine dinucleotide biosynthesis protein B
MELPMVELSVVGAKNSGKTTVIENLVNYLINKGFRVATIKHTSHSHRFDTPGKDSFRHRQAGARLTVAISKEETAIFAQPNILDIQKLQDISCESIDVWLIEGGMLSNRPKILITRQMDDLSETLPEGIVATIGPRRIKEAPVHYEEYDYDGLGSFVINTLLEKKTEIQR